MEFWFEFASTYTHPTALRVEALAAERGVRIRWRAFLLGPIFRKQGWNDSPFNLYPAKGRYMWRDVERVCERQGVRFRRPSVFPRNGLSASRVACRYEDAAWLPEFVRRVYRANFEDDHDIASPETLERCLAIAGSDPAMILHESQSPDAKAMLRAQTEEAAQLGIFGSPSFRVGEELFWGNDRLEQALDWAAEQSGAPSLQGPHS